MKDSMVPDIRFGEFERTWEQATLGEYFEFKNGINADKEQYGSGIKFINVSDILNNDYLMYDLIEGSVDVPEDQIVKNEVKYGDVLFQRSSETRLEVGTANVYLDSVNRAVFGGFVIRGRGVREYSPKFMNYLLKTSASRKDITSRSGGSTRYNIGQESLSASSVNLPSLPEQQKIAAFLTAVDGRLAGLRRQRVALERYKRGVMQGVFSGKSRLGDKNGLKYSDWKTYRLKDVAARMINKNTANNESFVLTNSASEGIVSQTSYFDKEIANSLNLDGYYVVEIDDFVYNPRISNKAPVGPIKRNNLVRGVMSPLYTVFRFKKGDLFFYEKFFETTEWHRYMNSVANFGARHDRMNITNHSFMDLPLPFPSLPEQRRIATFLRALDDRIGLVERQLAGGEAFKRGLLQKMFV